MKRLLPTGLWTSLLLALICQATQATPVLNGLSSHSEFNKERFIGALYVDNPDTDAASIFNTAQEKRIELRIISARIPPRQLTQMWIEGMAINSDPELLTREAANMVAFTGMVKSSLVAGDNLAIRQAPGQGTTISVNDIDIGHIDSDVFFQMLLSVWLGNVPLSSEFRSNLLRGGDVDSDLQQRFFSTRPQPGREQEISQWLTPEPAEAPTVAATTAPPSPAAPAPLAVAVAAPQTLAIAAPTPISTPPVAAQTTRTTATAADTTDNEEETDEAAALTVDTLLEQQKYLSALLRWTYKNIRYPDRAVDRKMEGSVRLRVTIDQSGQVLSTSTLESSPHELLNREALKAVERANPFPTMPATMSGEFSFSLPITFRLPD